MAELIEIARTFSRNIMSAQPDSINALERLRLKSNALIELLHCLQEISPNQLKPLYQTIIDEMFVDFHPALVLALGDQFKSSLVISRTCIEGALALTYFVDHPVEARMWAETENKDEDISFSNILNAITAKGYLAAATGAEISDATLETIKSTLRSVYRELSERVHGRYKFLQVLSDDKQESLVKFADLLELAISGVSSIIVLRLNNPTQVKGIVNLEVL